MTPSQSRTCCRFFWSNKQVCQSYLLLLDSAILQQAVCTDRSEAEKLVDKHIVLLEKLFANNSGFLKRQVAEARQREEMLLELHSCTSDRRLLDDEDRRSVLYTLSSLTGVPYPPLSGNTQVWLTASNYKRHM